MTLGGYVWVLHKLVTQTRAFWLNHWLNITRDASCPLCQLTHPPTQMKTYSLTIRKDLAQQLRAGNKVTKNLQVDVRNFLFYL